MSLLYHCGEIVAHSPLQNCFNSVTLKCFKHEQPVYGLAGASQPELSPDFDSVTQRRQVWLFETFRGGLAVVFWIIVLLHNPSALKLQGLSWYPDILFHDFLVASTIHGFINYSNSSRAWSSKADRDHHAWLVVWSSTDFHQSTEYFQWSSRCFSFLFVGPVVDLGLDLFPWTQFLIVESWALTLTLASGGL